MKRITILIALTVFLLGCTTSITITQQVSGEDADVASTQERPKQTNVSPSVGTDAIKAIPATTPWSDFIGGPVVSPSATVDPLPVPPARTP